MDLQPVLHIHYAYEDQETVLLARNNFAIGIALIYFASVDNSKEFFCVYPDRKTNNVDFHKLKVDKFFVKPNVSDTFSWTVANIGMPIIENILRADFGDEIKSIRVINRMVDEANPHFKPEDRVKEAILKANATEMSIKRLKTYYSRIRNTN